jgi:hypothetical protein
VNAASAAEDRARSTRIGHASRPRSTLFAQRSRQTLDNPAPHPPRHASTVYAVGRLQPVEHAHREPGKIWPYPAPCELGFFQENPRPQIDEAFRVDCREWQRTFWRIGLSNYDAKAPRTL